MSQSIKERLELLDRDIFTPFLTTKELSIVMKVAERTLRYWRDKGVGPKYHWWEGKPIYYWHDVAFWAMEQRANMAKGGIRALDIPLTR